MSNCNCAPSNSELCTTVYPTLNPCDCDSPAGIQEIGPTGNTGPKGFTPKFSVGTVAGGEAAITVVSTGYATRSVNFVLPAIPEGVSYVWSQPNTFERISEFRQGVDITGGSSVFGGVGFFVTPNAAFAGDVRVDGNSDVTGDVSISTHLNEDSQLTVQGESDSQAIEFFYQTNVTDWDIQTLPNVSAYPSGVLLVGDCLAPLKQPNIGRGLFTKGEGTALTVIGPVDSGPICATIVVNVPVSACVPQVTPVMDVRIRVGYRFGNPGIFSNFNASLWQGSIGGTQVDFYTQGDGIFNANAGFFELRGRATLVAGNNNFIIEVTNNDTMEDFTPSDVTYWFEN